MGNLSHCQRTGAACITVSRFHQPAYFSRDTIEADSCSWVANYVRLSPFQAQLWSNWMKKQDQAAKLKNQSSALSLSFSPPVRLPLSVSLLPLHLHPSLVVSCYIYTHFFFIWLCLYSSLQGQREQRYLIKVYCWGGSPDPAAYSWASHSLSLSAGVVGGLHKGQNCHIMCYISKFNI